MTKRSGLVVLSLAVIALIVSPAMGQELLTNGGFESGYTTNWTLEAGSLNGTGLGESAHSGTKAWHGAWNHAGSAQTTTYYQDVTATASTAYKAEMWCKANAFLGTAGNDTHYFVLTLAFLDAGNNVLVTHALQSPQPNDAYQQLKLIKISPAGTTKARIKFSYVTTQMALEWKVWNVDDMSLQVYTSPVVTNVSPDFRLDNGSNTAITVSGANLSGVTAVKIQRGTDTPLSATSVVPAGDGFSMTCTLPTNGAAYGMYALIVEKTGFTTWTLAAGFAIRNPVSNLLVNGGFETGAINGDTAVNGWTSWSGGWGGLATGVDSSGSIYNPGTTPEGTYRLYERSYNTGDVGAVQTVTVVPGEYLTLNWSWGYGDNASPNTLATHQVGVFSGALTGVLWNPDLAQKTVGGTSGATVSWTADTLSFQVPAGVYAITISLHSWMNYGTAPSYASYWDGLSLTSTGGCGALQHSTVAPGSPAPKDSLQDISVTITGSNLNQVNGTPAVQARVGGIGGTYFDGTVGSQSNGSLTANFTVPAGGWPLGTYDVITYQTGCTSIITPAVFTVSCPYKPVFSTIQVTGSSPAKTQVAKLDGPTTVSMTVTGQNLDQLQSIQLYQPVDLMPLDPDACDPASVAACGNAQRAALHPNSPEETRTIVGTVVSATSTSMTVTFDFANKSIGNYRLEGRYAGTGPCGDPAPLAPAIELVAPADSKIATALANADFEGGSAAIPNWTFTDENANFKIMQNGEWDTFGKTGTHFAAAVISSDPVNNHFEQDISLFAGAGQYDLVLTFWVAMPNKDGDKSTVTATIIADEGLAGEASSAVVFKSDSEWDWAPGWLKASVDFNGAVTQSLKIKFDYHTTAHTYSSGTWGKTIVDDAVLYSAVSCPVPFADADRDGDVDQVDFAELQKCFGVSPMPQQCACFNRDGSAGISQQDVTSFEACATGPGITGIPVGCNP
jgi:hypothetical protein